METMNEQSANLGVAPEIEIDLIAPFEMTCCYQDGIACGVITEGDLHDDIAQALAEAALGLAESNSAEIVLGAMTHEIEVQTKDVRSSLPMSNPIELFMVFSLPDQELRGAIMLDRNLFMIGLGIKTIN